MDPIMDWMQHGWTSPWASAAETVIKIVLLAVVGYFFYKVVVIDVMCGIKKGLRKWARYIRIKRIREEKQCQGR